VLSLIKCIICRMIEFAKHWGPALLVTAVALTGLTIQSCIYLESLLFTIILLVLAIIFWGVAFIALYYDLRDAYRKDHHIYRGN